MKRKLLIAPNAFKGTFRATEVCRQLYPKLVANFDIQLLPLSDGGDGFIECIHVQIPELELISSRVTGPIPGTQVEAKWLWDASNQIAYIESAQACGLALLKGNLRPMDATTFGVGELIRAAQAKGAEDIYLGLGGTASTDGGVGALQALGWSFRDTNGQQIPTGGRGLPFIAEIIPARFKWPVLNLMTDVQNRLLGEQGAAVIFGPQKGATPIQVQELERGLSALWLYCFRDLKMNIDFPGSGAAGGLAAGLALLGNTQIGSGSHLIFDLGDLEEKVAWADVVITGEGRFDQQSFMGKVTGEILKVAQSRGKRTAVIAGSFEPGTERLVDYPIPLAGNFSDVASRITSLFGG